MATITLEYDGNNHLIQHLIEELLSVGAKEKKGYAHTMQALAQLEQGDVTVCQDFDDYLKKINE